MLDQDLKDLWQNGQAYPRIQLNQDTLMQEVATHAEYMEEKIRKRDRREIWAALFLIPVSVGLAIWFPQPLVKLSWALTVVCCLFLIYQLKRGARHRVTNFSVPLDEYLHQYRLYLLEQIKMLRRVAFWYVLPFSGCQLLYFIGLGRDLPHLAINIVVVGIINYVIYRYNQKAVREDLQPLLEKVDQAIAALEAR
ncbi:hypothetical protein [Rufibacter psychrotolerans]|uniref:hypothetical protein n=1 Tax=Rufibacter psychrotolerans TaxID=2812556 RepID=UPI001967177A|nr:hypothetical protein [Rufibacter sp. SYSU D00308]